MGLCGYIMLDQYELGTEFHNNICAIRCQTSSIGQSRHLIIEKMGYLLQNIVKFRYKLNFEGQILYL
jgi:hypothetical protein